MNPLHKNVGRQVLRGSAALFLGLVFAEPVFALDPGKDLQQYNCQFWTRQNGLPVNGINAIAQSKDGYLWLGTAVGLLRFDGREFSMIDLTQVPGIGSSIVTSLAPANDGGVWVGLANGPFGHYDGRSLSLRGSKEWGGLNSDVGSVTEGADGSLWVAARREAARITGTDKYEPIITTSHDVPINILFHFADSRGRHWFATSAEGLYYWQDGKLSRMTDPAVVTTLGMAEDSDGNIWVGTPTTLCCFDSNLQRKEIPPLAAPVRPLLVDHHGVLWIGTVGFGLVRYWHGAYTFLKKTDGLPSDSISALLEDTEGNLWVGTSGGLSQLRDVKFAAQVATADPGADYAAAVAPSASGGTWVASGAGVTYINGKTRKTYSTSSGLPPGPVKRVFEARNGDLYCVSGLSTLAILSGGKVAAMHTASTLVVGMVEDAKSVIVSVGGALFRADRQGLTPYVFAAGPPPDFKWIVNLAPGKDGAFWVASENGIFRVKDGTFRQWSVPEGLPEAAVLTIMEDSDGAVWASTLSGAVRLKDNQLRAIGRKDGLFDDNIYAIVPDDLGNFWIDAGRGIFRVRRQDLNDFADGKIARIASTVFAGPDSVTTADKTNSQEHVGCRSLDGRIWFPSTKGVVVIDPAHIPTNRFPPAVHLDRVLANRQELDRVGSVIVAPGRGELEFHFAALSFSAPEEVKVRYQLEGYDRNWVEAENRRVASYTNLAPGIYNFRVIAANGDGVWNQAGDFFRLELRPHFYQTGWFYSLCGVALLAALRAAYVWRVRLLRRKQAALQAARDRLEIQVAHRTSELARANSSLHAEIEDHKETESQLQSKKQSLEKEIEERKSVELEIERVHAELLAASRQAGMAEVATSVLHNVGNVLNSVNVSATLVADQVRHSKAAGVARLAALVSEHQANLAEFLTNDSRGQKIPGYLTALGESLSAEHRAMLEEIGHLRKNIEHIKDIVTMQQSYAGGSGMVETVAVADLIEDALRINAGSLVRHEIEARCDYQARPEIPTDKHKVMQILINLVRNAKQSCDESRRPDKLITVRTTCENGWVKIAVSDNGIGIPAENLTRIFNYGFTTKKTGHGFGLHSGALAAKELGGSLTVESNGIGCGATFTLELPIAPPGAAPA